MISGIYWDLRTYSPLMRRILLNIPRAYDIVEVINMNKIKDCEP